MPKPQAGSFLGQALDEESLEWLNDNRPAIAAALERELAQGTSPEWLRRFVMQHTQRQEIALRIEQAARALAREGD